MFGVLIDGFLQGFGAADLKETAAMAEVRSSRRRHRLRITSSVSPGRAHGSRSRSRSRPRTSTTRVLRIASSVSPVRSLPGRSSASRVVSSGSDSLVDVAGSAIVRLSDVRDESLPELSGPRVGNEFLPVDDWSIEEIVRRSREEYELLGTAGSEHSSAHCQGNTNGA